MRRWIASALLFAGLGLGACSEQEEPSSETPPATQSNGRVVLYSGRSKPLVEPLIRRFERRTGIEAQVRYGRDAALLGAIEEEGAASEADVLWANTAGALAKASERGLLGELPADLRRRPGAFAPSAGDWVPVTARFRVLAYAPDRVDATELPDSVLDTDALAPHEGRIGWTPPYSSFQDFVTALRALEGEEAAREWLRAMKALAPKAYSSNTAMLQALLAGEIDLALTNHYYVHRLRRGGPEGEYEGHEEHEEGEGHEHEEEEEEEAGGPVSTDRIAIHHFRSGDAGNLALVTGAARLKRAAHSEAAARFIKFLLSAEAQRFAAKRVHEYPVVPDIDGPAHLLPVKKALKLSPEFDPTRLQQLPQTLELLREEDVL